MAPVNVVLLSAVYYAVRTALSNGVGVVAATTDAFSIPYATFVLTKLIGLLAGRPVDVNHAALTVAVFFEYFKRKASLPTDRALQLIDILKMYKALAQALRLNKHCGVCGLKGHNRQNHSRELDDFLKANHLVTVAGDVSGAVDAMGAAEV